MLTPNSATHSAEVPHRATSRPIRNPIVLLLLWASKTDPRLVAMCSRWAIATQIALGVFVSFTAVMAFASAYYTISTIRPPNSFTVWMALGWAIFIGFLDREIVGGLDKVTAIVRPFLALFIGTLVAIPVELAVFEPRVDQELQRQYLQENKPTLDELNSAQAELDRRYADLRASLLELRKEEANWGKIMDQELAGRPVPGRSGVMGAGPVFQNAEHQQASVRQRIAEIQKQLDGAERSVSLESDRLTKQFQRTEVAKTTDFATRFEALDKVVHNSSPLYRLSWVITLALILIEMTGSLLKLLTPHVDYHHLVKAEIRENVARIDEISDQNYRLAIEHPEAPELSVSEKFAIARFSTPATTQDPLPPVRVRTARRHAAIAKPIWPVKPIRIERPEIGQTYLDRLCDSVMPLFGDTPRPNISIKPPDVFVMANAHCVPPSRPGGPSTIEFNRSYVQSASAEAIKNTMKHELVHAWIQSKGISDSDMHGHVFIMKGKEVGCDVTRYERELADKRKPVVAVSESSNALESPARPS